MSTASASATHVRLVVAVGSEHRHVALRPDVLLGDALRAALVPTDVPGTVVLDSTGQRLDLVRSVGDQLEDGAALHVVRPAPRPRRHRELDPESLVRRPRPQPGLLALAGACGGVLLVAALLGAQDGPPAVVVTALTAGLALLALVVAIVATTASPVATIAAPLLAAAAGAWSVLPSDEAGRRLAVVVALVAATAAAAVRAVAAHAAREGDDEAVVVLGALVVAASLVLATVLLDLPAQVAPALLVGGAPLVLRVAPRLALTIPDDQLVDVSQVARTAESVRAPRPRALGRVSERLVARTVHGAERRVTTAVVIACALTVLLTPGVVASADPGSVARWGALALVACVVLAFVLVPRTQRNAAGRWTPRLAAGALLVEAAASAPDGLRVVAAVAALVVGLVVAVVGAALARGWHSVVASRLADGVEGLVVVLALPAGVVASGLVEVLRRMVG